MVQTAECIRCACCGNWIPVAHGLVAYLGSENSLCKPCNGEMHDFLMEIFMKHRKRRL